MNPSAANPPIPSGSLVEVINMGWTGTRLSGEPYASRGLVVSSPSPGSRDEPYTVALESGRLVEVSRGWVTRLEVADAIRQALATVDDHTDEQEPPL